MTEGTDPNTTLNGPDGAESQFPTPPGPEPPQTPRQVTFLLTMALPDQFKGFKIDLTRDPGELPKNMIVTEPDQTIMLWAMLKGMERAGHITEGGPDYVWPEAEFDMSRVLIPTDVAGTLSIHAQDGRVGVYELHPSGDLLINREFPDREAAEAYMEETRQMDLACTRIMQSYKDMTEKWINDKAAETGLGRRLVREFIGGIID